MNVFIDLFSGLGGASAAFEEDRHWVTIKIDNKPELVDHNRGLILQDISDVDGTIAIINARLMWIREQSNNNLGKLVIWASPPCEQFSWARADRVRAQVIDEFDMTLLNAAQAIIEHFRPDYWIIENVHGAIPIFAYPVVDGGLGCPPTQQIGSVILWGFFPLIAIEHRDTWRHAKMEAKGSRVLRPNYRALIPWSISKGLLDALTMQRTLTSYGVDAEQDA